MTEMALVCATCGRQPSPDEPAGLTWTLSADEGRTVWTCPECSRRYLRSIESKLDPEWW